MTKQPKKKYVVTGSYRCRFEVDVMATNPDEACEIVEDDPYVMFDRGNLSVEQLDDLEADSAKGTDDK